MDLGNWIAAVGAVADEQTASMAVIWTVGATVAAVASAFWAWRSHDVSIRHARYSYLAGLMEDYGKCEMREAVDTLWEFFKSQGEDSNRAKVEFARMLDEPRADGKPSADCDTLDRARRVVSHFYQRMAALHAGGLLPEQVLYNVWSNRDLRIIPKVIVPLEEALYVRIHARELTNEFDYLRRLYNDSPKK